MNTTTFVTTGDGYRLAYRLDGDASKPVLVLSNSIATTLHMWDGQTGALAKHFRVLRYDARGHGESDAPAGAYSMDRLGRDVIELLDALGIEHAHFLGLSLGGFVGQWLGIHAPERIDRLILSNTSPRLGPPSEFDARIEALRVSPDMAAVAEAFLANWFPASMIEAGHPAIEPFRDMLLSTSPRGLAGSYAAVRDADMRRTIALIQRPTLVIAGANDTVTLASHGEYIAANVPGARLVILPVVHLPNVEHTDRYVQTVLDFLLEDGAGSSAEAAGDSLRVVA
ncbi:3-oxoadipate enol-lactonase [Dyella jiangningensis]|uniref:3-oxoadipate enol-lactonase n=1 Tax=Dyella jiangningensis TaxID=1379159 RepID=UPI0004562F9B|nr:3-oxoadipate enol-lactonase [Dyella jiangningensis]AHX13296.1 3-oxoadipate enol-lactonase [Dyella jiangningensis]MDG2538773.1 3-oxoadipate enol-lactonase [Dyella jiangningensis]